MVKGVSRRVIVVRPDNSGLFEQAIFLVRDYTAPRAEIMREACRIADGYTRRPPRRGRYFRCGHLLAAFALGMCAAGLIGLLLAWLL